MNSNKVITIQCSFCHKEFNRTLFRYQYSEKYRGHRHFCSRSCKVRYFNPATIIKLKCNGCHEEMEMELTLYTQRNKTNNGVHYCCNACFQKCRKDRTPFGYFVDKGRQRSKQIGIECDLDNNFLKELWNRQKGICPYTGISMILPETKKEFCKSFSATANLFFPLRNHHCRANFPLPLHSRAHERRDEGPHPSPLFARTKTGAYARWDSFYRRKRP